MLVVVIPPEVDATLDLAEMLVGRIGALGVTVDAVFAGGSVQLSSVPQVWPLRQQPPPREAAQLEKPEEHVDGEMITVRVVV